MRSPQPGGRARAFRNKTNKLCKPTGGGNERGAGRRSAADHSLSDDGYCPYRLRMVGISGGGYDDGKNGGGRRERRGNGLGNSRGSARTDGII